MTQDAETAITAQPLHGATSVFFDGDECYVVPHLQGGRYRAVSMALSAVVAMLTEGSAQHTVCLQGLPRGTEAVAAVTDRADPLTVAIIVAHPSWPPVAMGCPIPTFSPRFRDMRMESEINGELAKEARRRAPGKEKAT